MFQTSALSFSGVQNGPALSSPGAKRKTCKIRRLLSPAVKHQVPGLGPAPPDAVPAPRTRPWVFCHLFLLVCDLLRICDLGKGPLPPLWLVPALHPLGVSPAGLRPSSLRPRQTYRVLKKPPWVLKAPRRWCSRGWLLPACEAYCVRLFPAPRSSMTSRGWLGIGHGGACPPWKLANVVSRGSVSL